MTKTDPSSPTASRPPFLQRAFGWVVGEAFLGFLAILSAALTLLPMLFRLSPKADAAVDGSQWIIVALFALEFCVNLAKAQSKQRFLLSAWRLVDLATIVVPLVTLVPGVSQVLRSSPALRLLRLVRVLTLGVRASGVIIREEQAQLSAQINRPVEVRVIPGTGSTASARVATWDEFVTWAKKPGSDWYSVANVGEDNVSDLAAATGIPREFIVAHLFRTGYPHAESAGKFISLFVWVPEIAADGTISRDGLLLLAAGQSIITLSRRPTALLSDMSHGAGAETSSGPSFPADMVCRCLKLVLRANESLVGSFEQQLAELEELPVRESRPQFFERTFRLKKDLSAAQADLWRLRGLLRDLADARVKLPGHNAAHSALLKDLGDTADYLYETVNNTREGVLSLIDLHLNVVSFEMNRVMRVLAVVSILGLIPAVIGGLFGMNLSDNPWPFTLPQVTFAVCFGMITSLYFFVVKGWLR